jgi:hypothetical protein
MQEAAPDSVLNAFAAFWLGGASIRRWQRQHSFADAPETTLAWFENMSRSASWCLQSIR